MPLFRQQWQQRLCGVKDGETDSGAVNHDGEVANAHSGSGF
jgi:hypothetical protein